MDIFSKPTNSFKSNHHKHWLKKNPFSLAHRTWMITERTRDPSTRAALPERIVKAGINKALKHPNTN